MKHLLCVAVVLFTFVGYLQATEVPTYVLLIGHCPMSDEGLDFQYDVHSIAFSHDGKKVVTASDDGTAFIWDVESGKILKILRVRENSEKSEYYGSVYSAAFSPDGKRIVTGSADARIWDAETGKEVQKLEGHAGEVISVTYSPDGKMIATGSHDRTVRIWDAESGKELQKLGHWLSSVAFSPDGEKIVTAGDGIRIWDAKSGKELQKMNGTVFWINSIAFSSDRKKIVIGSRDATIRILDAESGKEIKRLVAPNGKIFSVAFLPGDRIVSVGSDPIRIWDSETGKVLREIGLFKGRGLSLVVPHPEGRKIAVAGGEGYADIIILEKEPEAK